jgi:hypothetical protein
MPQHNFLFDKEENLLVDFVGKFERLQEDFNKVCKRLGISKSTLPHINKSFDFNTKVSRRLIKILSKILFLSSKTRHPPISKSYKEYYDNESKEFVSELYRKDIESFGYRFDSSRPSER